MRFSRQDFEAFHPKKRKSREFNQQRLQTKRKLSSIQASLEKSLQESGAKVKGKTSLHHPFIHNNFYVSSLWLYFAPEKKVVQSLKKIMGPAFSEELKSSYAHLIFVLGINWEELFLGLKINEKAWWDGQNFKQKCAHKHHREEFVNAVSSLTGFHLQIHDWKKLYPCEELSDSQLNNFCHYYTPGNHWFHLDKKIPREEVLENGEQLPPLLEQWMIDLVPAYQFILWTPENNFIFQSKESN